MISGVNGSLLKAAYQEPLSKTKTEGNSSSQSITKQGDTSRIEALKNAIDSGEYRVDIEKLAKRIAHELT